MDICWRRVIITNLIKRSLIRPTSCSGNSLTSSISHLLSAFSPLDVPLLLGLSRAGSRLQRCDDNDFIVTQIVLSDGDFSSESMPSEAPQIQILAHPNKTVNRSIKVRFDHSQIGCLPVRGLENEELPDSSVWLLQGVCSCRSLHLYSFLNSSSCSSKLFVLWWWGESYSMLGLGKGSRGLEV